MRPTRRMRSVGLVAMAAKPYHAGHDGLVRIASEENDEVLLFVSTSDRTRKGEMPIYGADMKRIWNDYIEPTLPDNVEVVYGGVPVQQVYAEIEAAESTGDPTVTYKIYSDDEDILKYTDAALKKSAPKLFKRGQIERRGVSRTETVPVSGTKMRELLAAGNAVKFARFLPPAIQQYSQEIIDILTGRRNESFSCRIRINTKNMDTHMKELIREYVSNVLLLKEVKSPDLKSGTMLGYAGEQAVYAAMGAPLSIKKLEVNLANDSRISNLYTISQQTAKGRADWAEFVQSADVMKQNIASKFREMGLTFARPAEPPGGGTEEYDVVAVARTVSGKNRTFNIHVKYKSDRLVGIPQPKIEKIRDPKTGKIDKEATEAAIADAAKGNPSIIYKNVRDAFLFKAGVEGGTGTLELGDRGGPLKKGILTPNGNSVRNIQLKASDTAPSEIAVIINSQALRDSLYNMLEEAGFVDVISSSIKKQLGLEVKGKEKRTSMFVNFSENDVHVQKFAPEQGRLVEFELVPGAKTSSAFTVTAIFIGTKEIVTDAFNVELGSIVRAKYVQIHKGKNFNKFVEVLESTTEI